MTADPILNFGKPVPKADPGTYPAKLVGIEPFTVFEGTPDAKPLIRWQFSLDGTEDPEMPGFEIILEGVSSTATGKRSKMRGWVTAIYGQEIESAVNLTTLRQWLIGKPCMVAVTINDDGYSKVDGILAAPRRPAAPQPVTAASAEAQHAAQEGDAHEGLPF